MRFLPLLDLELHFCIALLMRFHQVPIYFVSAWLLAASSSIVADGQPSGETDSSQLIALATKALSYRPRDEFAPAFDDRSALFRHFTIAMPFPHNEATEFLPANRSNGWHYDRDNGLLTVTLQAQLWIPHEAPDRPITIISGFQLSGNVKHLGKGIGENAFGARTVVSFARLKDIGIAPMSSLAAAQSVQFDPEWNVLTQTVPLAPEEAKKLVANIRVVIDGTVMPLENGRALLCGASGAPATFETPTSVAESFCVFNAIIKRVAIQSGSAVIAEWLPRSAP